MFWLSLWIPLTLTAACLQILRTGLQKSLQQQLDDTTATWARYVFALPLVPPTLLAVYLFYGELPTPTGRFWLYCFLAGAAQIVATIMLLAVFSRRSFAVGTAFAKMEGVFIGILGVLVFAEPPSAAGGVGIALGGLAAWLMSPAKRKTDYLSLALGLSAGLLFALTAWFIRLSNGQLDAANVFVGAACALSAMVVMQSLMLWLFLLWRKTDFTALRRVRRRAAAVGLSSFFGSYCWAAAFMLSNPAYVKTLAQIELPLAILVGRAAFREKLDKREAVGMLIAVGAGALVIVA